MSREELSRTAAAGSGQGWAAPLTQEGKEYFTYLRTVFKRYSSIPSMTIRLECNFVFRITGREFFSSKRMRGA